MQFFNFINTLHPNIKFTMEEEYDDKINFLDTIVSKNVHKLKTTTYHKKTATRLFMNFDSLIPYNYKISLILGLFTRAYRIGSDWISINTEFRHIIDSLTLNGFLQAFVIKC